MLADVDALDEQPTRSSPSREAVCHAVNGAAVFATNRRLTALLLVPRLFMVGGTGSKLRAYRRVATPKKQLLDHATIRMTSPHPV